MSTATHFIHQQKQAYPIFDQAAYDAGHFAPPEMYHEYHGSQPGYFPPHHHQHVQHLQLLQQQALAQRNQAYYYQYALAYQQHEYLYMHHQATADHQPRVPPNGRVQTKAERRAAHNAIERDRREFLNSKLQELAHSLPNLQNDQRPSKGTIIERTIDYVRKFMEKEEDYRLQIQQLSEENKQLEQALQNSNTLPGDDTDTTDDRNDWAARTASCPSLAASSNSASPPRVMTASPSPALLDFETPDFFINESLDMYDPFSLPMNDALCLSPECDDANESLTSSLTNSRSNNEHPKRDDFVNTQVQFGH